MTIVVVRFHVNYRIFSPAIQGERKKVIHFVIQGTGYKTAGTQASQQAMDLERNRILSTPHWLAQLFPDNPHLDTGTNCPLCFV